MAFRSFLTHTLARSNRRVTDPSIEPVTATELRTQLRLSVDEMTDAQANSYIAQARNYIEEISGLAFITQSWRMMLDNWPGYQEPWWDGVREMAISELAMGTGRLLYFPRYPLIVVSAITTYNEADVGTAITVSTYFTVDTESRPGRLALKSPQAWPTATRAVNAVQVDYSAGFGATAASVPPILRGAILTMAAYLYDHRGECNMSDAYSKSGAEDAISTYAVRGL